MCSNAAILADELQVGREVVVPAGRVDVALAQKGLRRVLLSEENKLSHDSGKLFFLLANLFRLITLLSSILVLSHGLREVISQVSIVNTADPWAFVGHISKREDLRMRRANCCRAPIPCNKAAGGADIL